jgi:phospholipase C
MLARRVASTATALAAAAAVMGCGAAGESSAPHDGGRDVVEIDVGADASAEEASFEGNDANDADAAIDDVPATDSGGGDAATTDAETSVPFVSAIKHVIVVVQENHSFDTYFGRWCTAPTDSSPTCNDGPSCCEAAPDKEPGGASPVELTDDVNANYDPNHTSACEAGEMNGGRMDRYVSGASCSNAGNFALATTAAKIYQDWAASYAIADRYFQPLVGQSSSNDMYFAKAQWVFNDNDHGPLSNGKGCITIPITSDITYSGETTLGDVLIAGAADRKSRFGFYAEGYHAMVNAFLCPTAPSTCTWSLKLPTNPCDYDPSDVPFEYYAQFKDNADYMLDYDDLTTSISSNTLRAVSFVKPVGYHNEHPGYGTKISVGATFVKGLVDQVLGSAYAADTLILITWDEGGGFFDHVTPPANSPVDGKPYGTRVPLLALGRFAKSHYVSHVTMEHSSVVRFLEWNFLEGATGQLHARDAVVNGIGDLLDPAQVGGVVP